MELSGNIAIFLVSVVFISLTGVMMPGPVFAVTIAKGHRERKAGMFIAFGHGIVEFPLMILIYVGFAWIFTSATTKTVIGLVGGVMLVYLGVQMFKARRSLVSEGKDLPYNSTVAGIATTGANPYFFLWWATIGASLILAASGFGVMGFILLATVHWFCDLFWLSLVSTVTFKSKHLWSEKTYEIVFGVCAAILIIFGFWFIISAL